MLYIASIFPKLQTAIKKTTYWRKQFMTKEQNQMTESDIKFNQAIQLVLKHEGGYVNNPNDAGGPTNFGISQRSYPHLDIQNLTQAQAIQIYRKDYWDLFPYDEINDNTLCTKVFDLAVNMGPLNANKCLQEAVISCGQFLTVDGYIGPISIAKINLCNPEALLAAFKSEAAHYYKLLVMRIPTNAIFLKGWLNRVYE